MSVRLSGMACLLLGMGQVSLAAEDWRLAGTVMLGEGAALIETHEEQLLLRVGDVHNGCELLQIAAKAARFRCQDVERRLTLGASFSHRKEAPQSPVTESEATVTLAREEVMDFLVDRQRFVSGLPLEPVVEGQAIAGYRLLSAASGGLARRAGFRAGDIMRSVNGVGADRGGAFMQALNALGESRQALIGFERDGRQLQKVVLLIQ